MPKNHTYVLGINAYDHDVSACLLRDGEIAYAIEKERITRKKHAGGFFQEVGRLLPQCRGITIDDLDLVVRNCYVLPVEDLEVRMIYQGDIVDRERAQASKSPLYLPKSYKVMTVSHHLAHAYSAFAAARLTRAWSWSWTASAATHRTSRRRANSRKASIRSPANPRATTNSRQRSSKR